MRRVFKALFWGLLLLGVMELFHRVSPHTPLPGIFDFALAPGFLPLILFYPDGRPPDVIAAFRTKWLVIGYLINFVLYAFLTYGIIWWRERRMVRFR